MDSIFKRGKTVTLENILEARDKRVRYQSLILSKNQLSTLIDIKLNIPGPIKNNKRIHRLYKEGLKLFLKSLESLKINYHIKKQRNDESGNETFLLTEGAARKLKKVTVHFEDKNLLGRLFDIDVMSSRPFRSYSREGLLLPQRKCFLCSRPAKECARSRRHSLNDLYTFINQIYIREFECK